MLEIPRYSASGVMTTEIDGKWIDEVDLKAKVIARIKDLQEEIIKYENAMKGIPSVAIGTIIEKRELKARISELKQDFGITDKDLEV